MTRPPFADLEALPGHPEFRNVNGSWITRDECETCGWYVVSSYQREDGTTVHYWKATLAGLESWGRAQAQRRADRKAAWQAREEEDQAQRDYVDSLLDAKPAYRSRRDSE